jgi:hypothetical protein
MEKSGTTNTHIMWPTVSCTQISRHVHISRLCTSACGANRLRHMPQKLRTIATNPTTLRPTRVGIYTLEFTNQTRPTVKFSIEFQIITFLFKHLTTLDHKDPEGSRYDNYPTDVESPMLQYMEQKYKRLVKESKQWLVKQYEGIDRSTAKKQWRGRKFSEAEMENMTRRMLGWL